MDKKETQKVIGISIVTALITTIIAGSGFFMLIKTKPGLIVPKIHAIDEATRQSPSGSDNRYSPEAAVIATVKKANPAVVAITISKNVPVYERYFEKEPSPLDDFFGDALPGGFNVPRIRQNGTKLQEVGGGSGFLVSTDGYIVTNRHVVDDQKAEYTVFTNDGKKYPAKVIARDPSLDLAIIKIDGSNFPNLSFGDSDNVQVGQSVIAIGNALAEFRNTVSVGIVSGLSRSITASNHMGGNEALDQLIQTDAAINPGNSGGPLLNLDGDVIGVDVAVADAQNIGFALSANSVKNVVESVQKTGKIVRPYLGIRYTQITDDIRDKNNLSVDYGILVQRGSDASELAVIPGSPADKAGILENDIILEINGTKLTSDQNLAAIVRTKKIGDTVKLKLLSKGKEKNVTVTLEEMK